MKLLVLGIGSNLGDRQHNLKTAITYLDFCSDIRISSIIESDALLMPDSPKEWNIKYLNMAVAGYCDLHYLEILKKIQQIELLMGRPKDHLKWSPRIIDIDILLYGEDVVDEENIKIPHPNLHDRKFSLYPAREIAPELFEK